MKKKSIDMSRHYKKDYQPPNIEATSFEMEEGIAAASATFVIKEEAGTVLEEWETGTNRETNVNW